MLIFQKFAGINNVQPEERLTDAALTRADNVDFGLSGEITRRDGYVEVSPVCHKNLYQAQGYMLATVDGDLTAIHPGGARHIVSQALGVDRVWYTDLPGGLTAFSNGLITGVTDGTQRIDWGVPTPQGTAQVADVDGALHPGDYTYHLTFVAPSGREGAPVSSAPVRVERGGMFFMGLPVQDGYRVNIYISGHDGEGMYLAGTASAGADAFLFKGPNESLTLPCRTVGLAPAPAGTVSAFWRGRALVAQGDVLWASLPHNPLMFDQRRDFKQMGARITLVQPVGNGIYVGTDDDLIFLAGTEFDKLLYQPCELGAVVLGSGVAVPGEKIKLGRDTGSGEAMVCIAGGHVVAGFDGGQISALTDKVYRTTATEVSATFRDLAGVPQYLAVPQ